MRAVAWPLRRAVAALGAVVVVLCGCSGPTWEKKTTLRRERIQHYGRMIDTREQRCEPNLEEVRGWHRASIDEHRARLRQNIDFVEHRIEAEFVDWPEHSYTNRANLRKVLRAKPESIPDAWASMIY